MDDDQDQPKGDATFWIVVAAVAFVIVAWLVTPFITAALLPATAKEASELTLAMAMRGQAGDTYGSVNALFSGLAFVGIVVAIILQSKELGFQRREIRQNRAELARATRAQQQSHEELERAAHAHVYRLAVEIVQDDDARVARSTVLNLKGVPIDSWDEEQRLAAAEVCRTYDALGKLGRYGLLPVHMIVDSWGEAILRTWRILEPFVIESRTKNDSPKYLKGYQDLAVAAAAARDVQESDQR